jgi:predicted RNase H-like HicB family nuclease
MKKEFNIVIEQDEDGYYIASVPELPGCHTQAKSLDELNKRVIEAIELYLEVDKERINKDIKFIGFQKVEVSFEET